MCMTAHCTTHLSCRHFVCVMLDVMPTWILSLAQSPLGAALRGAVGLNFFCEETFLWLCRIMASGIGA